MSSPMRNTFSSRSISSRRASRRASRMRISTTGRLLCHVGEERGQVGFRAVLGELDRLVHGPLDPLGDLVQARFVEQSLLLHRRLEGLDRIALAVLLNLVLEPVELR